MDLYEETLLLIQESGLSPEKIAAGAGLRPRWLRSVIDGDIDDPGSKKLQKIHNYLLAEKRRKTKKAS